MDVRHIGRRAWSLNSCLVIFIAAICAWIVSSFSLNLTFYEQILWVFVCIFLVSASIFGISIFLPVLLPLSIVSRGVFNLIGAITPFDVLLFILSGSIIVKHLLTKRGLRVSKEGKVFIAFLLIVASTEIIGFICFPDIFFFNSFKPFIQLIEYLLVFLCVVNIVKTPKDIKKYVILEFFCGILFAFITLYEAYFGLFTFGITPIFSSAYYIGYQAIKINPSAILLLVPTFWLTVSFIRTRRYLIVLIPLLIYVFILSSSRSLYLGILGGMVGMLYLRNISRMALVSIAVLITVLFNLDFLAPKANEVFEGIFYYFTNPYSLRETSTVGRIAFIETALLLLLKHPLWGYGINGFGMELYSDYSLRNPLRIINIADWFGAVEYVPQGAAHNQYLQVLADHGIVALILFCYLMARVVKISLNLYKKVDDPFVKDVSQALFLSLISFIFASIGVTLFATSNIILPMIFWFNLGLIYSIKRMFEKSGNKGITGT